MTILDLLTEKGFVEGVDYTFDGTTLVVITEQIPELHDLKKECVERSEPAFLISEYLAGRELSDDDSINVELFLKGGDGWRSSTVPAPSIEVLYDLIPASKTKLEQNQINEDAQDFLNESDWKILRHLRQQTLGIATSMTTEEFMELEQLRHEAALRIVR